MPSTRFGSDKYQLKSHWFDSTSIRKRKVWIRTRDLRIPQSPTTGGRRSRLVHLKGLFTSRYLKLGPAERAVVYGHALEFVSWFRRPHRRMGQCDTDTDTDRACVQSAQPSSKPRSARAIHTPLSDLTVRVSAASHLGLGVKPQQIVYLFVCCCFMS